MDSIQREIKTINKDLEQFNAEFNFKGQTTKELEEELVLARQIHEIYYPKTKNSTGKTRIGMKINKTYYQKQNPKYFVAISVVLIAIYFGIYYFLHQHAWLMIPVAILLFVKARQVQKNPISSAITIDEEGIYIHSKKTKYEYAELADIQLGSKYKDGYVLLKDARKKVHLNSVAISLEDQEEIQSVVQSKITRN